jgi:hypothetical protein
MTTWSTEQFEELFQQAEEMMKLLAIKLRDKE